MDLKKILEPYNDNFTHINNITLALIQFNTHIPYESPPEIWKELQHPHILKNRYLVSSWGRIYDLFYEHYPTPALCDKGYVRVSIQSNNNKIKCIRMHSLIANTFIPNPENKFTVNHKDFNKQNNTIENLEWMSYAENIEHAHEHKRFLIKENKSFLTEDDILDIKTKHKNGLSFTQIAKDYNRLPRAISDIVKGKSYNYDFWFNQGFRKENNERYKQHYKGGSNLL